jgi:hypothetical protein
MSRYVLIQSKSPWESRDVDHFYSLARDLVQAGSDVTFFLVQNGVMAARMGATDAAFDQLLGGKVNVFADDFSPPPAEPFDCSTETELTAEPPISSLFKRRSGSAVLLRGFVLITR